MSKQEQLLAELQAGDFEAFKLLTTDCGPFIVTYLTIKLENYERAKELALHLFMKWAMQRFATATCPLPAWMASQADAECDWMETALN